MLRYGWLLLCLVAFSVSARDLPDFADLAEKQGAAVVNIGSSPGVKREHAFPRPPNIPEDDPFYEFFRRFMPQPGVPGGRHSLETQSLGSGFIVSADGYILTNGHVVEGADEITVRLTDKREFKARIIGTDRRTDIAVLKIDASGLPTVRIGDPARLRVGEWVVAIGSPFGFDNSVTAGIVSAKGRALPQENLVPFIQTDVAVNPGNSGGPLFNLKGEVVGINSQIYSRTGGFMGLSFAIPIDVAMEVANQLRQSGRVARGWMGIRIQDMSQELAGSLGLSQPGGALVSEVESGSPAAAAGVQKGDVILTFGGKPIENANALSRMTGQSKPGQRIRLGVWRETAQHGVEVQLGESPDKAGQGAPGRTLPLIEQQGLKVTDLPVSLKDSLKVSGGVLVDSATGHAARARIRKGDVIIAVNAQDVRSLEHFNQLIAALESRPSVALLILRGSSRLFVALPLQSEGKPR